MKKVFGFLLAVLMLVPSIVKADWSPIYVDGYSKEAVVGKEIVFKITGQNNFDGRLEYNSDELEFVSIKEVITGDDIVPPESVVKVISNESGKLTFKVEKEYQVYVDIVAVFKVKSATKENIKVAYYPTDKSVLFGSESIDVTYPVVEAKEETKCDNTCLYISWGIAGVFAISTLCLAVSKKRK